ncbi:hypothetical protein [Actomonas aquatica]|uniref:Uncharacterized protein n=1 Tax=Actomonas aquatica TaxID=2866162 RepID=A0ABZ1CDP3_9BACT|nr:hypothetical protein [Opitutus sp. WL0086]WRQ89407.1 hypothetical protein K1X11_008295 [Opitutus sp. WL0086]
MAIAPQFTFDDPRRFPPLLRLSDRIKRPEVRRVMGRAIATSLRKHFSKLDRERPNKLGGRRTHFWGQVRRSVQQPALIADEGVMISINHVGIAQRYFGGIIQARPGGKLTIPVHPEAHGRRAREFDLTPIFFADGSGILVDDTNPNAPGGIGEVYYRLVDQVDQEPDPTVLPDDDQLEAVGLDAGEDYVRTLLAREKR